MAGMNWYTVYANREFLGYYFGEFSKITRKVYDERGSTLEEVSIQLTDSDTLKEIGKVTISQISGSSNELIVRIPVNKDTPQSIANSS